jgi:glycosyltransferase involved in cell wall biosynthesis
LDHKRRYVLVSPCRDEAKYIRRTLDSVAAQSVKPALWVVVDDGSRDETPAILAEYAARLPWLKVVRKPDRGGRSVGPGVIEAFYFGLEQVDLDRFDYVCKLDTDLDLPPRYFELLMEKMERDPRIGSISGKPWYTHPETGALVPETVGNDITIGAAKFYQVACYREIGGFVRQVMWDGIDCHRARLLGWKAGALDDEALRFLHLRPMGSSQGKGLWSGRVRGGFGQYFMGSSFLYFLAKVAYHLPARPVVLGSIALLWGWIRSAVLRVPRYGDAEFRRFLRRYQRACLIRGKAAALAKFDAEGAAVWAAAHPAAAEGGIGARAS